MFYTAAVRDGCNETNVEIPMPSPIGYPPNVRVKYNDYTAHYWTSAYGVGSWSDGTIPDPIWDDGMVYWSLGVVFECQQQTCGECPLEGCIDECADNYNPEANVTNKALWIIIPTIEGISYTFLIAWYDNRSRPSNALISRFIATVGNYSYSIYLLHFFFVFEISEFINSKIIALSNPYIVLLVAIPSFLVILPISFISFKLIETPFLRFRKSYLR